MSGLARELVKLGHEITVLTAFPNYPSMVLPEEYRGKWFAIGQVDGIPVYRSWIFVSKKRSVVFRLLNYFSFVFSSMVNHGRIKSTFDAVLCESPPLFLGISGWWISRRKKAKFIFNISDLWPESAEKLGVIKNRYFLRAARFLEEWLYKNSTFITGQTQGICRDILQRFPDKTVHWLPNGADPQIFESPIDQGWRKKNGFEKDDFLMVYAGIIGIAQGLDTLLDAASLLKDQERIKFLLVGDGPEKARLMARKGAENLKNVIFIDLVPRNEMPSVLNAADVALVPLKKMELFLGAIPSKIFENLAFKKPLLLAVDGEARELFIEKTPCGLFVVPESPAALADAALNLFRNPELRRTLGDNGYQLVQRDFMRPKIASSFIEACEKVFYKSTRP